MKKKVLGMILAMSMAASMAACGASGQAAATASQGEESAAAAASETEEEVAAEVAAESTEAEPVYGDLYTEVPYIEDNNEEHMLDIYGAKEKDAATKAVIEVHGGGFIGGDKETNIDHSIVFADAGYVVVTPEYSKVPREGDFKNTVQELFTAYQWVADHAEEYHIDTNNIFLSGDSAGGYYVLLSMAIMHDPALAEYWGVELPAYEFSGYVTTCPGADMMAMRDDFGEDKSGPAAYTANTIGEELLFDDDLMAHMDLFSNTDPANFTGLYMMTTPDDQTTGASVQKFEAYLNENGVEHILNTYESQENQLLHVFNISHTDWAESIQANQDEIDYMESLLK